MFFTQSAAVRVGVQGEWNGYKYKVPMEYHRTVEKMGYDELVQHNKAMKQRIEEKMQRNTKVRATCSTY